MAFAASLKYAHCRSPLIWCILGLIVIRQLWSWMSQTAISKINNYPSVSLSDTESIIVLFPIQVLKTSLILILALDIRTNKFFNNFSVDDLSDLNYS